MTLLAVAPRARSAPGPGSGRAFGASVRQVPPRPLPAAVRSFASVASSYDRGRPHYPPAAIEWLLGREPRRVVDLAAGTGKLTRGLLDAGHQVVAVEPLVELAAYLRSSCPGTPTVLGRAEALPLADGSVAAVTVGHAFHWFEADAALAEIARVLTPGGVLGVLWNIRDTSVAWVATLSAILHSDASAHADAIPRHPDFAGCATASFPNRQPIDEETLVEMVCSRSYVAALPAPDRVPVLDAVRALWASTPELSGSGAVPQVPYRTVAYRAVRRPARSAGRRGCRAPGDLASSRQPGPTPAAG